jgi:hypothetical protein
MRLKLFALAILLGTWNAHAQVYTYPNAYSIWNPLDPRIKYTGFAALVTVADVEVARVPVASFFAAVITVNFPAQMAGATVAGLRLGWTQVGATNGVPDLKGGYVVTYTPPTGPFVIPAGATTTVAYNTASGVPVVTVTPAPVVVPPPPLPPPVADTTPPVVSITAPLPGATIVGTNPLTASATDNVGVVGVQFGVDGSNYAAEITVPPYTTVWNSTTVADGPHTINAVARDAAGNRASSAVITVKVSNAPAPPGASPDGSSIPPLTQLIDAAGAIWTQVGTHPMRNGAETGGSGSILMTIKTGVVYFKQSGGQWWRWAGAGWAASAAP